MFSENLIYFLVFQFDGFQTNLSLFFKRKNSLHNLKKKKIKKNCKASGDQLLEAILRNWNWWICVFGFIALIFAHWSICPSKCSFFWLSHCSVVSQSLDRHIKLAKYQKWLSTLIVAWILRIKLLHFFGFADFFFSWLLLFTLIHLLPCCLEFGQMAVILYIFSLNLNYSFSEWQTNRPSYFQCLQLCRMVSWIFFFLSGNKSFIEHNAMAFEEHTFWNRNHSSTTNRFILEM